MNDVAVFNVRRGRALVCVLMLLSLVLGASYASAAGGIQSIGNCTVIYRPGSYVLAHNITAKEKDLTGSGPACILITADNVTLDLQGYTITGPGTGFGIYSSIGPGGHFPWATEVRNGTLTGFERGVALEGAAQTAKNLRVVANGVGISVDGIGHKIENVQAWSNGEFGLWCNGTGNTIRNSQVTSGGIGIKADDCSGTSIMANTVVGNAGAGIVATCPSLILQNMATQNAGGNIVTNLPPPACTLSDNNPMP